MKVPADLAGALRKALDGFGKRHPEGIDAYVANKMGWTMAELEDGRVDGSQVDTIGMVIEKIDDKTGFIIGSQTGAGKGRSLAAIMIYHIQQGRIPIFVTAQAKLFTDIWRDIKDVVGDSLVQPLIFNKYKAPKSSNDLDEDAFSIPDDKILPSQALKTALNTRKMPAAGTTHGKANAVFLTYSQLQST